MNTTRRRFFKTTAAGAMGTSMFMHGHDPVNIKDKVDFTLLDRAAAKPVLKRELFPDPVIIDQLELLMFEGNYICRIRSRDGVEGISVSNNAHMASLYPIFINRL